MNYKLIIYPYDGLWEIVAVIENDYVYYAMSTGRYGYYWHKFAPRLK